MSINVNSMEPVYHDGDTLLVEMTDSVEIGEIGIFLVNGESYVKEHGDDELRSLNPKSKNILITVATSQHPVEYFDEQENKPYINCVRLKMHAVWAPIVEKIFCQP